MNIKKTLITGLLACLMIQSTPVKAGGGYGDSIANMLAGMAVIAAAQIGGWGYLAGRIASDGYKKVTPADIVISNAPVLCVAALCADGIIREKIRERQILKRIRAEKEAK